MWYVGQVVMNLPKGQRTEGIEIYYKEAAGTLSGAREGLKVFHRYGEVT